MTNIAPIETKRFRSKTGFPVQVALQSGHIAYVTPGGSDLQKRFWKKAYELGCFTDEMRFEDEEELLVHDNLEQLREVMRQMIADKEDGDFTAAGVPNMKRLSAKAGFNVNREDMAQAWNDITAADSSILEDE